VLLVLVLALGAPCALSEDVVEMRAVRTSGGEPRVRVEDLREAGFRGHLDRRGRRRGWGALISMLRFGYRELGRVDGRTCRNALAWKSQGRRGRSLNHLGAK
jgi:hypothetical protein